LKGGVDDIKTHRWFSSIDWDLLLQKKITAIYKPPIKGKGDPTCFSTYPDSPEPPKAVKPSEDPFINW